MNQELIVSYCDSLTNLVESLDHILGMDEIYDFKYFIGEIKNLAESETNP